MIPEVVLLMGRSEGISVCVHGCTVPGWTGTGLGLPFLEEVAELRRKSSSPETSAALPRRTTASQMAALCIRGETRYDVGSPVDPGGPRRTSEDPGGRRVIFPSQLLLLIFASLRWFPLFSVRDYLLTSSRIISNRPYNVRPACYRMSTGPSWEGMHPQSFRVHDSY